VTDVKIIILAQERSLKSKEEDSEHGIISIKLSLKKSLLRMIGLASKLSIKEIYHSISQKLVKLKFKS